jgi:hypothetical protein
MSYVLMRILNGTVSIMTLSTFRGKPVALAYLNNTLNYNKMATTAKSKKVALHTEKQYEDLQSKYENATKTIASLEDTVKERTAQVERAFGVIEKFKKQTEELNELREKEERCDNTGTLRIIELISKREPSVRAVVLSNAISVIKFRAEEAVRRLETKHNSLIDELEKARAASNDIFELVK